jgi:hypothetical protein
MGHSIDSVLSVEVRSSELFRLYDAVRGFTAPIFLFVSGFAFMAATEKRWETFRRFGSPVVRRLLKVVLLLAIGYLLHVPFFSFEKLLHNTKLEEYAQFFQADVLHCVALSLLILQAIVFLSPTPKRFAGVVMTLGAMIVLATPFMWLVDFNTVLSPVVAPYLSQRALSIFPIFPYGAFLFAGAVAGHFYLGARAQQREGWFVDRLLAGGFLLIVGGILLEFLPIALYPEHDFWKASPLFFAIRLGIVLIITVGFTKLRDLPQPVMTNVMELGQASLVIYAVHLLLVYGSAANDGLMQVVGQRLPFHIAVGVALGVLGAMLVFVHVREFVRNNFYVPARFIQAAAASMILMEFLRRLW